MNTRSQLLACLAVVVALTGSLRAADSAAKSAAEKSAASPKEAEAAPLHVVRPHHARLGGADLAYTSTAEDVLLKDATGKPTARLFTVSYAKDGASAASRPVTFVFNGGPGSASMWLHLGLVGPRVIDLPSDAQSPGAAPYQLRDNPTSILRVTDLVFVDPVGTGYSHAEGDKKDEDFWGFDQDADSVAELIRTWVTAHARWNSPKYVLGESYGGIRSSLLVPRLQNLGIALNGAILISPALHIGTLAFSVQNNDIMYATLLPSLAATAWYHHRLGDEWKDLDSLLREAEAFAGNEYLTALFRGDRIDAAEKQRVAQQLHRFLGLPVDYISRSDLRVMSFRFAKELLRDQGKSIGLLDGRYVESDLDHVVDLTPSDVFITQTSPPFIAAFQSYLRDELGVETDRQYIGGNDEAAGKWKRSAADNAFSGFEDATAALAQGTKDQVGLRVFAAGGYNDLITPFFATDYNLAHSGIDADRLMMHFYPGGHMLYLYRPSGDALSADVARFIAGS